MRGISTMIHPSVAFLFLSSFLYNHHPLSQASAVSVSESTAPTAYEMLRSYDFPVGLLPKGVRGYDFDEETGKFNAYLNESCNFALEGSYQLSYKSKISGYISKGKLTKLSGISVKVLILWLNIVEVTRNRDNLEFSVGIASADFPIDNFYVCPQCGCGLDCNSLIKMASNRDKNMCKRSEICDFSSCTDLPFPQINYKFDYGQNCPEPYRTCTILCNPVFKN